MENKENQEQIMRKILSKNVLMVVSILSIAFGLYQLLTGPGRVNETQIAYLKSEIGKNQTLNDTLTKTQQNDLHTLEIKMTAQEAKMDDLKTAVVQLQTIINERIPLKK